ncbi:alpha-tubulin N-acetyltransferase 1 [Brachionichthys hirsutus]|uniref:alpha-tubulin N-acetyltransferase 1 n=1 Tax=Brachionichthys hirsutus TaxID=412623 RepID=UPI003605459B
MEFPFDVNRLFSQRVTVLDEGVAGRASAARPDLQAHIVTVIDELGRASAMAQQLAAPITSAPKLQAQKHQLYLLKEGEGNGGRGVMAGLLKVGHKKLFLLDLQGAHVEAEPLCVLDFYISEELQRHGCGLELFGFMLQHQNLEPVLMAYDRPSPKLMSFLAKHFSLTQSVPQVNNFVVFEGFFLNRSAVHLRQVAAKKPEGEIKPYSLLEREAVRQVLDSRPWPFAPPHSPQRSVSHHCSHTLNVGSSPSRVAPHVTPASAPGADGAQTRQSPLSDHCKARCSSRRGLVARGSLYSRHMGGAAAGRPDARLPGLRAGGGQSDAHRLAGTRTPLSRPQPRSPPPSCASDRSFISSQTPLDRTGTPLDRGAEDKSRALNGPPHQTGSVSSCPRPRGRRTRGWSWAPGENGYAAQWARQERGRLSTQPW